METLILIDGDFIPYYVCYNKKGAPEKTLQQVLQDCNKLVWNLLTETKATQYIGFLGVKGSGTFRHQLYTAYKANRKTSNPPYFRECRKHLIDFWKFIFTPEELEVDDCLVITKNRQPKSKDLQVTLVSPDKDILQLEGRHFNPRTFSWVDRTFLHEECIYLFWKDMLTGQSGDNIQGIPGMGEITAKNYLKPLSESRITDLDVLNSEYAAYVLKAYMIRYGERAGISQFSMNYQCLKILQEHPTFSTPTPQRVDLEQLIQMQLHDDSSVDTR